MPKELQLTFNTAGHQITNINAWSCDGNWLVYDVRPHGSSFTGLTIERVNLYSRETEVIYRAEAGAHVGVVTCSPQEPLRYLFIHGPENPDSQWQYDFHHRRGVIVHDNLPGQTVTLDAFSITPPYQAGALRGGTHVHVFSPDASRVSFTYNDHVLHEIDPALDLRNVGVAVPLSPTTVPKAHPREYDGSHYCVLVSRTTPHPRPGSDDINRAYEEGWIGSGGYRRPDGTRQRWALAFIGDTLSAAGEKVPEVFIVDLPEELADYARAGETPLAGTATTMPAPPRGVRQRRLTFTQHRRYPGLVNQPRHWLRASPDGSVIAFLMKDDNGIVQLWTISPNGGEPRQITQTPHGIQSAFNWRPDGRSLAFICDNGIMLCDAATGELVRLTRRAEKAPSADAVVFSPDGRHIAYMREINGFNQLFVVAASA
ncbi:Periplasmic component of the Tol biopolymer transport system|uniref:WD40 repeat protein n=1 Tax=Brenneria salicis ATCC 15712 = DSM 30166 TaxID=714314 RepID=A0A366I6L1_9GAMM|nr:DUF3748 domain-containing protein [Brenneria salicis]NMN89989.1 Periplasmic component of the Tol biopolymer transport system [Brenneria salicis ATCC 15712 = DSM 30166]RBP64367.1 WD40 repeat protein [Brenneria salicis ATCC 15712 = DSM 30166]RLM31416.1 biopolymer transporter Tol [Brenneria salicis ATCC 15712 = DSM 30166]